MPGTFRWRTGADIDAVGADGSALRVTCFERGALPDPAVVAAFADRARELFANGG